MNKYLVSQIGTFHTNHNEDAAIITELGNNQHLLAVLDGCSMGKESHFASTLMVKVLRKLATEMNYKTFVEKTNLTAGELLPKIMKRLFEVLKQIKNQLLLEREEMLSTLVLGIFDSRRNQLEIITIGDGLVCCNGQLFEYEQDDKPDYLGYHLTEDFDTWFSQQTQRLSFQQVRDFSLATDGIFTFRPFDNNTYDHINTKDLLPYLLIDGTWGKQTNMLKRKLSEIESNFGLRPSDDLTIVRINNH
ncbi:MAG: protein phosphatase 2C domain-containing protein [Chitinophagales bacterium]